METRMMMMIHNDPPTPLQPQDEAETSAAVETSAAAAEVSETSAAAVPWNESEASPQQQQQNNNDNADDSRNAEEKTNDDDDASPTPAENEDSDQKPAAIPKEEEETVDNTPSSNGSSKSKFSSWFKFKSPMSSFASSSFASTSSSKQQEQLQHNDEKKEPETHGKDDDDAATACSIASDDDDDKKPAAIDSSDDEGTNGLAQCLDVPREEEDPETLAQNQKLDQAFTALERMRVANLELELGRTNINPSHCVHCLREQEYQKRTNVRLSQRTWRIRKGIPCLVCGTPTCTSKHASSDEIHQFKEQQLTICGDCAGLFGLDFIMDLIHLGESDADYRRRAISKVIDSYDRARLILQYSAQFIDTTCENLEKQSAMKNKVGLGSSSVGILSGITGVAAAAIHAAALSTATVVAGAAVLTPIGPPLLIASIVFGGTAMATSSTAETVSYYSEPNLLADRIMALHELVNSLLRVTVTLRDALTKGHIDLELYVQNDDDREVEVMERSKKRLDRSSTPLSSFLSEEEDDGGDKNGEEEETNESVVVDRDAPALQEAAKAAPPGLKPPPPSSVSPQPNVNDDDDVATEHDNNESIDSQNDSSTPPGDKVEGLDSSEDAAAKVGGDEAKDDNATTEETTTTTTTPETRLVSAYQTQTQAFYQAATRTATLSMKAASMASAAFGVFSVASVILEAKNMSDTVERMKKGNKHPKVDILRAIKEEIGKLPETELIVQQCESYLEYADEKDLQHDNEETKLELV